MIRFLSYLNYIRKAHLSNAFWKARTARRLQREEARVSYKTSLLKKYIPYITELSIPDEILSPYDYEADRVFVFWDKGLESAPLIVRRCIESIREVFGDTMILLDSSNLSDYVTLPEIILQKYRAGKIGTAHLSDIFRLELLYKYGGYWYDATNFATGPVPSYVKEQDFFLFMSPEDSYTHMYVLNSFLRAKKGDALARMWHDVLVHYWTHENKAVDYFCSQMLFRLLVSHNREAATLFSKMPRLSMAPTHRLWYVEGDKPYDAVLYERIKAEAFFQKCSYRRPRGGLDSFEPGSMARRIIKGE